MRRTYCTWPSQEKNLAVGVPVAGISVTVAPKVCSPKLKVDRAAKGVFGIAVEPILVQAQRRHDSPSVWLGAGSKRKRHLQQKRLLLAPLQARADRQRLFRR